MRKIVVLMGMFLAICSVVTVEAADLGANGNRIEVLEANLVDNTIENTSVVDFSINENDIQLSEDEVSNRIHRFKKTVGAGRTLWIIGLCHSLTFTAVFAPLFAIGQMMPIGGELYTLAGIIGLSVAVVPFLVFFFIPGIFMDIFGSVRKAHWENVSASGKLSFHTGTTVAMNDTNDGINQEMQLGLKYSF